MQADGEGPAGGGTVETGKRTQAEAMDEFARRYGTCDISKLDRFIGEQPDSYLIDEITAKSGAIVVRTIEPGQAVSMEGNSGRLNVELDAEGAIRGFFCG